MRPPSTEANHRYYIIRDDMLGYLVDDVKERLTSHQEGQPWEVSDLIDQRQSL